MIAELFLYLFYAIPPDRLPCIPDHELFPGRTGAVALSSAVLQLEFDEGVSVSTGLWLPAGAVGTIECGACELQVQIGAHTQSLLAVPGPWRRWPDVVITRLLAEGATKVASPFGGIVYLSVPADSDIPEPTTLRFDGFCRHPRAVAGEPSVWADTKDADVPWGEFDAGAVIFTLPAGFLRQIADFEAVAQKFEGVTSSIARVLALVDVRPYRIIFDVDLPGDRLLDRSRLFFLESDMPQILQFTGPSGELFEVVRAMALSSMREGCVDPTTEVAIATVAAATAFQELFAGFDPFAHEFVGRPPLFAELWEIHEKVGRDVISQTLTVMQDPAYQRGEVPEEMWNLFVKELCLAGGRDFTKLLEAVKPIPRNITRSLCNLPVYGAT
jgi:hypothetical protein